MLKVSTFAIATLLLTTEWSVFANDDFALSTDDDSWAVWD